MCGILAEFYFEENKIDQQTKDKFSDNLSLMAHRGPDASNVISFDKAILGHRRLSIIDTSPDANQPLCDVHEDFYIIFNGEIFNYIEIREELKKKKYIFRTESDTEVLLTAYKEWGSECLAKLNGMFAFIIFSKKNNSVFIARDHFGIKPLYYSLSKDKITFSSEIKPLALGKEVEINNEYLDTFITKSACDFGKETLFENIFQLEAGSYIDTLDNLEQKKWFDLSTKVFENSNRESTKYTSEEVYKNSITESVQIRMRSDVPVAITLSGGMDSTSIYSIIQSSKKYDPITAYTIVGSDNSGDKAESEFNGAKLVTDMYRGTLKKVKSPIKYDLREVYKSMFYQEMPSWSLSHVLYDEVYKTVADDSIKVLLEGHGNDEILGGYPVHVGDCIQSLIFDGKFLKAYKYAKVYNSSQSSIYYKSRFKIPASIIFLVNMFPVIRNLISNMRYRLSWDFKVFQRKRTTTTLFKNNNKQLSYMQKTLIELVEKLIVPTVLRTFDRSTMRASIEMRPPFMDPYVVINSLSLKDIERVGEFGQKNILRRIMVNDLPDKIINDSIKRGFTADVREIAKLFDPKKISELLDKYGMKIGLDIENYNKCYEEFSRDFSWQNAMLINKVGSLLVWCDIFIGKNFEKYE